jgi:indole-3-glycerol phosphate synthase
LKYIKEILLGKKREIEKIYKEDKYKLPEIIGMKGAVKQSGKSGGNFITHIREGKVNVIAEIKKASPSRGVINDSVDIESVALLYDKFKSFICCASVLTESLYFKGSPEYIKKVKKKTVLPVLRKDFIFNEAQVYHSVEIGADCILLISSILGSSKLKRLYNLASSLGLDALVEIHNYNELEKALDTGAKLIGINNRNLKNMQVNERLIYDLLQNYGSYLSDKIIVCESGIKNVGYIEDLFRKGVTAFLIGEHFMGSGNLEKTLCSMELELKKGNLI